MYPTSGETMHYKELISWDFDLDSALITARRKEQESGDRYYVIKVLGGPYSITTHMPFIGEWFDSAGIKHG